MCMYVYADIFYVFSQCVGMKAHLHATINNNLQQNFAPLNANEKVHHDKHIYIHIYMHSIVFACVCNQTTYFMKLICHNGIYLRGKAK